MAGIIGAEQNILAQQGYGPILVLLLVVIGMVVGIMVLTHLVGPRRRGPVKDATYESGVEPIGDARARFDIRFYLIAVLFLLFDVEVLLLWPWAPVFYDVAMGRREIGTAAGEIGAGFLLAGMGLFIGILTVGYVYEWLKGSFR